MTTDVSINTVMAVYKSVEDNINSVDDISKFGRTLDEMFDAFVINDLDGTDARFRSELLTHYRFMSKLMRELDRLL